MFFEQKFLSQPHKYGGVRGERELLELAQKEWQEASEGVRQMYLLQETQQNQRYVAQTAALQEREGQDGRYAHPEEPRYEVREEADARRGGVIKKERDAFEVEKERAERERAEVEVAEMERVDREQAKEDVEMRGGGGGGGGFTSIN